MKSFKRKFILFGVVIASAIVGSVLKRQELKSYNIETQIAADPFDESNLSSFYTDNMNEDVSDNESDLININTASKEQLETLDEIGEIKAEQIIHYREEEGKFEVIEDIMKVNGIGRKTFDKIKDKITV